jgi:hypothetical protein
MNGRALAVSLAALATAAFSVSASAAETYWSKGKQRFSFEGFYYGGQLPVGAEKNADALRVLIKASDALGQLRGNQYGGSTYLVLGDTSAAMRINADGTWNGKSAHVVLDYSWRDPGVRLDVTYADGKREITVAAIDKAWDEKTPGVYAGQAKTSFNDRMMVPMLLPAAVVELGKDAADIIKASKDDRLRTVLTIPLPTLGAGVNLVARLDSEGRPVHTEIAYNGRTYTGDFDDFLPDRTENLVYSPHHIIFAVDGTKFAELEVNWHQTNPYLIFPVPSEVASK